MFPLPKRLSSSFGIIGNDPKLAFRTQLGGITRLVEVRNIAETDDGYWSQYVQLFDSATEVNTLITPQDIHRALIEAPENVKTLINVITCRLFALISDHTFPSPPVTIASGISNLNQISPWAQKERDPTKEVLNCLRVLGRVLPVVFDHEGTFEEQVLWMEKPVPGLSSSDVDVSGRSSEPQFVIDDESEDVSTLPTSSKPDISGDTGSTQPMQQMQPCLAEQLLSTTVDLMFCSGFSLPTSTQVDYHKINYVIWDKGIGSTTAVGSNSQLDSNKSEVLRFLLILLSRTIYHSPSTVLTLPNKYASHFVHNTPRRLVLSILCSLLNTAMNGEASAGWGGMVDKMPYNHLIMAKKTDEGRTGLIGLCLGLLCVLLDYQAGEASDPADSGVSGEGSTPTTQSNAFRYFLAKLHRSLDFDFVLDGVLSTLESDLSSTYNLLPGSRRPVPYILETFIFLWKIIELNKKFRAHLLESEKLLDLIAYLLCFCLENKDKAQHHGLCRALSYIIQSLSAEIRFATRLRDVMPSRIPIPSKWQALGTAGDFFITSIYSIVATTSGSLNSLYPALVIAIANVAPYLQNLTVISATKLVHLFTAFSSPSFLLGDDSHPRLVFFMLEALNGILFHQIGANPNLVYAILRSHKVFEEMGTFTLVKGLQEIRRIQGLKDERARQLADARKEKDSLVPTAAAELDADGMKKGSLIQNAEDAAEVAPTAGRGSSENTPETARPDSRDSFSPPMSPVTREPRIMSEKARGKMRERSVSVDILDPELERLAAAGIGKNGFVPTQEWVTSWQQGLPLDPVLLTISELLPKITEIAGSGSKHASSRRVLEYLKSITLDGVLPPAPPLNPRRFQWSDASLVWLSSLIWGELYVRGSNVLGVWNGTNVRLFGVRHTPSPRGVGEAVQNVVGGMFGGSPSNPTPGQNPATPSSRIAPQRLNSSR